MISTAFNPVLKGRQLVLLVFLFQAFGTISAQEISGNPIIKHLRTADPSVEIWEDGQVWIYASHDPDDATDYSTMDGYHVFSSFDLVNWTDHGEVLHSRDVSWGLEQGGFMFAPDAAYKDGTYYFYYPHPEKNWKGWRIGVATSDRPEGPFTDQGFIEGTDQIDPTVFIDDDGQAYLTWAGDYKGPYIARLKDNMMELAEEPRIIDYGSDDCGEGPYIHKRNNIYYFSYTDHAGGAHAAYAMSDNIYGPYEYKGRLAPGPPGAQDHHSMIEYHGQWYYFYHVGNYGPNASMYRRNVCIDSMFYNEDGTIQLIEHTGTGVAKDLIGGTGGILVPGRVEAEDFFREQGTRLLSSGADELMGSIHSDDHLEFVVDILGKEYYELTLEMQAVKPGTEIHLLLDEQPLDTLLLDGSSSFRDTIFLFHGKHVLKLLFRHSDPDTELLELDYLDLYGEFHYHPIEASSTEGGRIYPEGRVWVREGEDQSFRFEAGVSFILDSLHVDGVWEDPAESFTFTNVQHAHSLQAWFAPCDGTAMEPWFRIGNGEWQHGSHPVVTEGDSLVLKVEYQGEGDITWFYPRGRSSGIRELDLEEVKIDEAGTCRVVLLNEWGCSSVLEFEVEVEAQVLDVYQAEDWHEMYGVKNENCTDLGGGLNVAYIETGDWCSYQIEIDTAGVYDFIARVATASWGGYIRIYVDGEEQGHILVEEEKSNGWQDWYTTAALELTLQEGTHELKLSFIGGGGYLFNFNWFDLAFRYDPSAGMTSVNKMEPELSVHPGPSARQWEISYLLHHDFLVSVDIYDLAGRQVHSLLPPCRQSAGRYSLHWYGDSYREGVLADGLYLLVFSSDHRKQVKKLLLY